MAKEEEQQRFLELSALFNKNNAIKHIILLEQKIADYESSRVELPVKPEIADKELINARQLVMLLSAGFKVCDKSVATHWCNIYEDKAMYNVYIQP